MIMYFNSDGILVDRSSTRQPVLWFPLNWIIIPIAAYRRKLKEMQALHFDE